MRLLRVWALALLAAGLAPAAHALPSVFCQSPLPLVQDPCACVVSDAMVSGSMFDATASFATGEFRALTFDRNLDSHAYAGILVPLTLTNDTGSEVTVAAGALELSVLGSYAHTAPTASGNQTMIAQAIAVLQVTIGTTQYVARGDHHTQRSFNGGMEIGSFTTFTKAIESNGAQVVLGSESVDGLALALVMPELVLAPGAAMTISALMQTNAFGSLGGSATSDFLTGPRGAFLSLSLPAGVSLTSDCDVSCGPHAWISVGVPEPSALALLATTALLLAARRRRSARSR